MLVSKFGKFEKIERSFVWIKRAPQLFYLVKVTGTQHIYIIINTSRNGIGPRSPEDSTLCVQGTERRRQNTDLLLPTGEALTQYTVPKKQKDFQQISC